MTKEIKLMEYLVDLKLDSLTEQFFMPSMETAKIKGQANVGWTDCYGRRCENVKDEYARDLCKEYCKRESAQDALGKVRGLLGFCNKAKNPKSCADSVRNTARAWDNRISRIDDKIAKIKREMEKYRAKMAGRKD